MKTLPYYRLYDVLWWAGLEASSTRIQKQNTTKNHMAQEKFPKEEKIIKNYHYWKKVEASNHERPWSNTTKKVRKSVCMFKITKQKSDHFMNMLDFVVCFQGE